MIKINKPMPQCCDDCFAFDDHGDYSSCWISHCSAGYNFDSMHRRMSNCPLIEEKPMPAITSSTKPEPRMESRTVTVRAFLCPVCQAVIYCYTPQCPTCGMTLNWGALYDNT